MPTDKQQSDAAVSWSKNPEHTAAEGKNIARREMEGKQDGYFGVFVTFNYFKSIFKLIIL